MITIHIQDRSSIEVRLEEAIRHTRAVISDSHFQRVRKGHSPDVSWYSKNLLIFDLLEHIAKTSIPKKIFMNYPFNIY